jgi:hypothetical protein
VRQPNAVRHGIVLTSRTLVPQQPRRAESGRLLGDFISLLVGFEFHPSSISKEYDDPEADNKDDTEHKDDTGVLTGPVLSFGKEMKAISLRSVD